MSKSFNGKLRDECLNEPWFVSLPDAKATTETSRIDYNTVCPTVRSTALRPNQFPRTTEGTRRLTPTRPDQQNDDRDPRVSHYPRSGF